MKMSVKSALFGLLTFVLVGSSIFWAPAEDAPVRPLSVEEREMVLTTLERLEYASRQLSPRVFRFSDQFSEEELAAFLELRPESDSLVRFEVDAVFFSPRFFAADSVTQDQALESVVAQYTPVSPQPDGEAQPNEIAVVGE